MTKCYSPVNFWTHDVEVGPVLTREYFEEWTGHLNIGCKNIYNQYDSLNHSSMFHVFFVVVERRAGGQNMISYHIIFI